MVGSKAERDDSRPVPTHTCLSLPSHPIYDVGLGRKVRQGRMWGRMGETG